MCVCIEDLTSIGLAILAYGSLSESRLSTASELTAGSSGILQSTFRITHQKGVIRCSLSVMAATFNNNEVQPKIPTCANGMNALLQACLSINVDRAVRPGNSKVDSCGHTYCLEMPLAALVLQPDAAQVC